MELLATVHWVATHEEDVHGLKGVIEAVHRWSARKRRGMKPGHIEAAWRRLSEQGWLGAA
jgi:hypothetical protein